MKLGIRGQLFVFSLLLILIVGLSAGIFLEHQRRTAIESRIETELLRHARSARELMRVANAESITQADRLADRLGTATASRITVIARDGRVMGDSELTPEQVRAVENHGRRPEVLEALASGQGVYRRYSTTLNTHMLYVSVPYGGTEPLGTVRAARPLAEVDQAITELRLTLFVSGLLALLLAVLIGGFASDRLTRTLRDLIRHAKSLSNGSPAGQEADDIQTLAGSFNHLVRELELAITELRRLEQLQREFVANASHELRTPVSVIRANAETLMAGARHDQVMGPRLLEALDRNAERLVNILSDLLDLARLDARQSHLAAESLSVAGHVDHVVQTLQPLALRRAITIDTESVRPGDRVLADPAALDQILQNLLDNAIKYAPENGHVRIASSPVGDRLEIRIQDDGPGIPDAYRSRLFQRFYRVDPGRSRNMGGTGLGLSIVKELAETMGGCVGMKPASPTGCIFWVRLPQSLS